MSLPDLIKLFLSQYESRELPSYSSLLSLLDSCVSVLESEFSFYRPVSLQKKAGGLLDFTVKKDKGIKKLPVLVVPDLHGRERFVIDILKYRFPAGGRETFTGECAGHSVLECLEKGLIYVCLVGDIFHSEARGRDRWIKAFNEYTRGNLVNDFMKEEMKENLSLLEMLLILKTNFAGHFHILKGNHENVLNEMNVKSFGNVPFRKFCDEGNMVADFLQGYYDDLILHEISCFEKSLPVCAVFENCIVSHAEPASAYTREEIINYHEKESSVVFGLTWTANDKAEKGSVEETMKNLLGAAKVKNALWFGGHRPIEGKFLYRQNEKYIQIHNPGEENIAFVFPDTRFNPFKNIISVEE